jgi:hypothetical protein
MEAHSYELCEAPMERQEGVHGRTLHKTTHRQARQLRNGYRTYVFSAFVAAILFRIA